MHELPVTQSILDIALRHANEAGATRIKDLYLVIGQLSSIIDDSVQFYWDIISEGTIAEGATLHFQRLNAEMHCAVCDLDYRLQEDQFACPQCGNTHVQLVSGDEFYIESLEVETDETPSSDNA
ncbi:MAG: hydrogenase maturation nickel metallochaperone HypA [Chloroflexi bacterium]|nr:hydrogenase maturation nickel metallochaperone HypA [Chloroflexota bacterium]